VVAFKSPLVVLFDVDNTLLDNDRVTADMKRHLLEAVGGGARRYWEIFEELRSELGYADYLGALQRFRVENPEETRLLEFSGFLIDYPFANRLYPGSLDAVARAQSWGPAVVFSDGDVVFQPRKIQRSGLFEAFGGHVLIYVHKEKELHDVEKRYPSERYVLVDDKPRILGAVKKAWGDRVRTVFPRQGHYALEPGALEKHGAPDVTLERIGQLAEISRDQLLGS
jgi:FMN phosphatase YigB (HAD superfamily)